MHYFIWDFVRQAYYNVMNGTNLLFLEYDAMD